MIRPLFLITILLLISLNIVSAIEYIDVKNVNIDSFGGLYESKEEIYVGSIIRYNISLSSENKIDSQEFNILIINPSYEIIENSSYNFNNVNKMNIASNVSSEWKLIYADVPGIYKLVVSSKSSLQLFENKSNSFRHDYSLPFYFEVKTLQEKRWSDANEKLIQRNEELAKKSETINTEMLSYTKNIFLASLAMLLVAIITLFSTPQGRNIFLNFLKWLFIIAGVILFLIILSAFLSFF